MRMCVGSGRGDVCCVMGGAVYVCSGCVGWVGCVCVCVCVKKFVLDVGLVARGAFFQWMCGNGGSGMYIRCV